VRAILAIAFKDLGLVLRDPAALLFTLIVPVVVITIVAASLGGTDANLSIRLPVVNADQGPVAEVLIEALTAYIEVEEVDRPRAEALVGVEKEAAAALVLPEHMSKNYLGYRPSTLTLLTDPAKGSELATVKALLLVAERDAEAIADPFSEPLLVVEEQNVTGSRLTTTSFEQNIPGFSVMFVLMGTLFGIAFALDDERVSSTLTRMRVAPIAHSSYLGGKLLARYLISFAQMLILFIFGHLFFGLPLGPSPLVFGLTAAAVTFSMVGFGLLMASFVRSREQIIPLGLTIVMIVCSIGGCWWPPYVEPHWLQQAAHLFLTAWAMDGLLDLILRERGFLDVWPTLAALMVYGALCLGLGARLHRFEAR
jgi:ABC-2 type transport system permease protein